MESVTGTSWYGDGKRRYDVGTLWALSGSLPVERHDVSAYVWVLGEPVWSHVGEPPVTPRMVLDTPDAYADHTDRIEKADLQYPILVVPRVGGEGYDIADGVHRLCWCFANSQEKVAVRVLPQSVLDEAAFCAQRRTTPQN